jgi:hypothetical protein
MQRPSSRYDQRALTLIDACLAQGRFTDETVSEIIQSFGQARRAERRADARIQTAAGETPCIGSRASRRGG